MSKGTLDDPMTLNEALSSSRIKPGHTVWLRGGIYRGDYECLISGAEKQPVYFRPYPGETVTLDGALVIRGTDTVWHDLNITYTGWTKRASDFPGSTPEDIRLNKTLIIYGERTQIINWIIQDCTQGIALWSNAPGSLIYGCVIAYCGWWGPDRGHGHGIYTQNNSDAITEIRDSVLFSNFSLGIKVYAQAIPLKGYRIEGNTCYMTGTPYGEFGPGQGAVVRHNILVGGLKPVTEISLIKNMTYHLPGDGDPNELGFLGGISGKLIGNYWPEGWKTQSDITLIEADNDQNTDGNPVFVRPNQYNSSRATITIYNEAETDIVSVDVSSVFQAGQRVQMSNTQDYYNDVKLYMVGADGHISVDMRAASHSVYKPALWTETAKTFPRFGCFIAEAPQGK